MYEKYKLSDGGEYYGEIKNGKPCGLGYAKWADGSVYRGSWDNGQKNGIGLLIKPNGEKIAGSWFDGEFMAPLGKEIPENLLGPIPSNNIPNSTPSPVSSPIPSPNNSNLPSGGSYSGNMSNGLPEGQGICTWPDGSRYEGNWSSGMMHGIGTMFHSDSSSIMGVWYENNLITVLNKDEKPSNGTRLALIIGNCDYPSSPLRNCINDAEEFARKLRARGFDTLTLYNGTKYEIEKSVEEFCNKASRYEAILFFFSGHGCQNGGKSYLVPVDYAQTSLCYMDEIVAKMDAATPRIKIAIIDACRSQLERSIPNDKGLFDTNARNVFLAYATASGCTASDGRGEHSPYMEAILDVMEQPRLGLDHFFREVVRLVRTKVGVSQVPWIETCAEEDFYFNQ